MGVSSVHNVAFGVLKMKVAALLLGLYQSLLQTAATVASMGVGTAGTRQIATAHGQGDAAAVDMARRALFWGTLALAVVGGAVFALLGGLRRIGDLARIQIGSAAAAVVLGMAALWAWGENGLLAMVLVVPAAGFVQRL
jgi:PST family polysaccharide transporter